MTRIAFDVHGTLDHDADGLLMGILNGCIKDKDDVYIISGPPIDQIVKELTSLEIDTAYITIISVVDWLKKNDVYMWQDDKGDWWCDDDDWWSSKGKICAEYGITMMFDDKIKYKRSMPETTKFILWEGTKDVTYYGRGGKSSESTEEI